ncbi:MAG: hypothetical protein AB4911_16660 [Oscillochloridaceae bacterium umkhey_bin13]
MQQMFILGFLSALLLTLGPVTPVAATPSGFLPPLRLIQSARFEHAFTEGGQVVLVGQGFKESRERIYLVLRNLSGPFAGRTRELVLYDRVAYLRVNDDPEWQIVDPRTVTALIPTADLLLLFDGPISRLDNTVVGGTSVEHYQIWGDGVISNAAQVDFVKVDFFVGPQNRYLYQLQLTSTAADVSGGTRERGTTVRFFDHNDPSLIVRPPQIDQ